MTDLKQVVVLLLSMAERWVLRLWVRYLVVDQLRSVEMCRLAVQSQVVERC